MIRAYDEMLLRLERELLAATRQLASRDYALLNTVPGIGRTLALTILYEIDSVERFPTVKDFCSYCRLVKGSVASAGKLKGTRGAKLGNPYLRWAFGEAADHLPHLVSTEDAPRVLGKESTFSIPISIGASNFLPLIVSTSNVRPPVFGPSTRLPSTRKYVPNGNPSLPVGMSWALARLRPKTSSKTSVAFMVRPSNDQVEPRGPERARVGSHKLLGSSIL